MDTGFETAVFELPDVAWTPVSRRLAAMRRAFAGVVTALVLLIAVALYLPDGVPIWLPTALALVALGGFAWAWRAIGRNQESWGYAERGEDFLVRRGVMFRQLVLVPYGRMQFVDVSRGPVQRRFGMATVKLHTAAAATDARIPGLTPEEAVRLRDRLAAYGEARSAGL